MKHEDTSKLDLRFASHIANIVVAGYPRKEKRHSHVELTGSEEGEYYRRLLETERNGQGRQNKGEDFRKKFWKDIESFMEDGKIKPEKRLILRSVLHYLEKKGETDGKKQVMYEAAMTATGETSHMVRGTWRYYYPKLVDFLQERG